MRLGFCSPVALVAELRRRKVWRVAVVYAVAATGVAGAAEVFFPRLLLPDWTVTLTVVLAVLGFPLALALAWSYDLTWGGIERTRASAASGKAEDVSAKEPKAIPKDVSAETSRRSIVVLPFDNLSPDPADAYFSDGLTEEIITNLSYLRGLRVISRNSAMVLKGTAKDTRTIGRELDVGHVLEGSVRKAGDALRITAQLIDAKTDAHLWAEKYDGILEDVFAIQEQVSRSIVEALEVRLTSAEERRIGERRIDDIRAYQAYLRAVAAVWQMQPGALEEAAKHVETALEILGPNPHLYSGLAFVHWNRANMGVAHEEAINLAKEYVAKALELDPDSSVAWSLRGACEAAFDGKVSDAIHSLSRALQSNPDETLALVFLAVAYLNFLGQPNLGEPLVRRLTTIDPLSNWTNWLRGALPFFSGNYTDAAERWGHLSATVPETPMYEFYHAWALAYQGNSEGALRVLERPVGCGGGDVASRFCRILNYALQQERDSALVELTPDFRRTVARDGSWAHMVAAPLAFVGATDEAIEFQRQGVNVGFVHYPMMAELDPFLVRLRGDPRYEELLADVRPLWESSEQAGPLAAQEA